MNQFSTRLTAKVLLAVLSLCGFSTSFAQQLAVELTATQPTCAGYTNGSLTGVVTGGQQPFTYLWNDGATQNSHYGLNAGTYTLNVTDAAGAVASATATLSAPQALALIATGQGDACVNVAGNYLLAATGGRAPYTYQIDGVASGAQALGLLPGYRYATVTDANGCMAGTGIQVAAPLSVTVRVQNVVCNGYCDGTVEAQIAGGTGPFTFLWNNGSTEQLVYGLDPGVFTVVVTDGNGCTATASGTLTEPSAITFSVAVETPCANGSFATVTATGGTGALTIRWSTGAIGSRVYLEEGQHYVYIRDENGCEVSQAVLVSTGIQAVVMMNVDATCDSLGRSLLCITGGRGPFTYRWSDGQTGIAAINLAPGIYSFTLIDGAGCRFDGSTEIFGPDPASCLGCVATSGSLGGGKTTPQACGGDLVLTASVVNAPTVPTGYTTLYLLTSVPQRTILQTSPTPSFTVQATGSYTIHTLVFDPATLDPATIQVGTTQISALFLLIQQGGGSICAGLDMTGTTFIVPVCNTCPATPGTLTGGKTTAEACGDMIQLNATSSSNPVVPAGYIVTYVLTSGPGLTIVQVGNTPSFTVTDPGSYRIHTLVYDPATFDISTIVLGQTTATAVLALLQQGGGIICAALDASGTLFTVPVCSNPLGCTGGIPAALRGNDVCFDGTTGQLSATVVRAATVPAGYRQAFLLISLPSNTIVDVATTPGFIVSEVGRYEIRSLVYHPDSLNLERDLNLGTTLLSVFISELPECQTLAGPAGGAGFDVSPFDPAFSPALTDVPCAGEQVTLNPGADTTLTYRWTPAAGLSSATSPSPTVTLGSSVTYQVEISRLINGVTCSTTKPYTVTVEALPSLAGLNDVSTCTPSAVTLEVNAMTGNTIVWSDEATFGNVLSSATTLNVTSGVPKTYFVRATSASGCVAETSVTVGDYPLVIAADDDLTICAGEQVTFAATATTGVASTFSLLDAQGNIVSSNATGSFSLSPPTSSSFTLIAQNAAGCTDTADIAVQVSDVSTALFAGASAMDTTIYPGNPVDLTAVSNGGQVFVFDSGDTYLSRADSSAVVMPTETTTYSVVTTDENGCTATASLVISVLEFVCERPYLFVPNMFTPDADGVNDVFFVDGVNVDQTYYAIFNRWGQLVFEGTELGNENGYGWDGTFNGQRVEPDVFGLFVRIRCNDGDEFYTQGNVTVIR